MKTKILIATVIFIINVFFQNSKTFAQEIDYSDNLIYNNLNDSAISLMTKSTFICCSSDWCDQNDRRPYPNPSDPSQGTSPNVRRGLNVCPRIRRDYYPTPKCGECKTVVSGGVIDMGIYRISDAGTYSLCFEMDLLKKLKSLQDSVSINIRGIEDLKIVYEDEISALIGNSSAYEEKNLELINLKKLQLKYTDLEDLIQIHNEIVTDLMKQYIDDTIK